MDEAFLYPLVTPEHESGAGPLLLSWVLTPTPKRLASQPTPVATFSATASAGNRTASSCTQADFAETCSVPGGFVTLGVSGFSVEM